MSYFYQCMTLFNFNLNISIYTYIQIFHNLQFLHYKTNYTKLNLLVDQIIIGSLIIVRHELVSTGRNLKYKTVNLMIIADFPIGL